MDVVTEEDPIGIKTDGVYIQSTFSVDKAEPEVRFSSGFWVFVLVFVCVSIVILL